MCTHAHMASKSHLLVILPDAVIRRAAAAQLIVFNFQKGEVTRGHTGGGATAGEFLLMCTLIIVEDDLAKRQRWVGARETPGSRERERATVDLQALKPDNYHDSLVWLRVGPSLG